MSYIVETRRKTSGWTVDEEFKTLREARQYVRELTRDRRFSEEWRICRAEYTVVDMGFPQDGSQKPPENR